jgi:hypothetical protein
MQRLLSPGCSSPRSWSRFDCHQKTSLIYRNFRATDEAHIKSSTCIANSSGGPALSIEMNQYIHQFDGGSRARRRSASWNREARTRSPGRARCCSHPSRRSSLSCASVAPNRPCAGPCTRSWRAAGGGRCARGFLTAGRPLHLWEGTMYLFRFRPRLRPISRSESAASFIVGNLLHSFFDSICMIVFVSASGTDGLRSPSSGGS